MVRHPRAEAVPRGQPKKFLETPEGWAIATLLGATLSRPPIPGSARESVLIEYYLRLDEINYARDLAQAQLALDPKEGAKRFDEFRHVQFPWLRTAQKREREKVVAELQNWAKSGPIQISRDASTVPRQKVGVSYLKKAEYDRRNRRTQ